MAAAGTAVRTRRSDSLAALAYASLGIWAVPLVSSVAVALVVVVAARLLEPLLGACWE